MVRQLIRKAARTKGAAAFARAINRHGVRVLMYHRFPSEVRELTRQCEHIRRHYHPVSLQDLAGSYREGRPLPPAAIAVTIDDGYRDFLHGHRVFQAYGIPTTVFLVSDFVDGCAWLWVDLVSHLFTHTGRRSLTLESPGVAPRHMSLSGADDRRAAALKLCAELKEVDNTERLRTIAAITRALEVDVPALPPPAHAALTWDEVRQLSAAGVEFGAHTKTHPILSRISDPRVLDEEIRIPKEKIETETGAPVAHFCYPNGRRQDFTADTVAAVARAGFQTAVTTERGLNFAGAEPLRLRRLGVDPRIPLPYFEQLLAGTRAE